MSIRIWDKDGIEMIHVNSVIELAYYCVAQNNINEAISILHGARMMTDTTSPIGYQQRVAINWYYYLFKELRLDRTIEAIMRNNDVNS